MRPDPPGRFGASLEHNTKKESPGRAGASGSLNKENRLEGMSL
jgi:hypothetical protein